MQIQEIQSIEHANHSTAFASWSFHSKTLQLFSSLLGEEVMADAPLVSVVERKQLGDGDVEHPPALEPLERQRVVSVAALERLDRRRAVLVQQSKPRLARLGW
jgi:hypothetical protein